MKLALLLLGLSGAAAQVCPNALVPPANENHAATTDAIEGGYDVQNSAYDIDGCFHNITSCEPHSHLATMKCENAYDKKTTTLWTMDGFSTEPPLTNDVQGAGHVNFTFASAVDISAVYILQALQFNDDTHRVNLIFSDGQNEELDLEGNREKAYTLTKTYTTSWVYYDIIDIKQEGRHPGIIEIRFANPVCDAFSPVATQDLSTCEQDEGPASCMARVRASGVNDDDFPYRAIDGDIGNIHDNLWRQQYYPFISYWGVKLKEAKRRIVIRFYPQDHATDAGQDSANDADHYAANGYGNHLNVYVGSGDNFDTFTINGNDLSTATTALMRCTQNGVLQTNSDGDSPQWYNSTGQPDIIHSNHDTGGLGYSEWTKHPENAYFTTICEADQEIKYVFVQGKETATAANFLSIPELTVFDATLDACGVCGGDSTSCADACGVPNGDNSTCTGCDGVINSGKVLDACDICDNPILCFPRREDLRNEIDRCHYHDHFKWRDDDVCKNIRNWDVSRVTNMDNLFNFGQYEHNFFSENLDTWDVIQVTSMVNMFKYADITGSGVSYWDVSNVRNMQGMFYGTNVLGYALSNWDVSQVTNMQEMFYDTPSFMAGNQLNNWDVSNVTNMQSMFQESRGAQHQDFSTWDVRQVTNMNNMFKDADDFSQSLHWQTHPDVTTTGMFDGTTGSHVSPQCIGGEYPGEPICVEVQPGGECATGADSWEYPCYDCPAGKYSLNSDVCDLCPNGLAPNAEQDYCVECQGVIDQCGVCGGDGTTCLDCTDTVWGDKVVDACGICGNPTSCFPDKTSLKTEINRCASSKFFKTGGDAVCDNIRNWDVSRVTNMDGLFYYQTGLQFPGGDLSNWDVSQVTSMQNMFNYVNMWDGEGLENWNVSNVKNMQRMFYYGRYSYGSAFKNWDVSSVTNMQSMFEESHAQKNQDFSTWDVRQVTNMNNMFKNAPDFSQTLHWQTHPDVTTTGMFDGTTGSLATVVNGCTDSTADNYDANANTDDGSCEFIGCTDPTADNYDAAANTDDGSCEFTGCTDSTYDNYDENANTDDESCACDPGKVRANEACVEAATFRSNRPAGNRKQVRKQWRDIIKPTRDPAKSKRANMARLEVANSDLSDRQEQLMTKLEKIKPNIKAIMTVATERTQRVTNPTNADCEYDIANETATEKEILMPYAVNNYAYICIGDTPIAEVKETASETEISCWNGNDWDAAVTTDIICGQTSILVGSATTECDASLPECCDDCGVCDTNTTNDGETCADCAGEPNGDAVEDDCGVCGGDNSTCADCAGEPNGGATLDNCNVCDTDTTNDGETCGTYDYGIVDIELCPNDDDINLIWTGRHNIKQIVGGQFVGDPLVLPGSDADGFLSNGVLRILSADRLSNWNSVTTWGCTDHPGGRITATCNQPDPNAPTTAAPTTTTTAQPIPEGTTCESATDATQYQQLGCCEC